ncbi:MAG TPA: TCR/Tet family MFS transporter [Spongiibacteraceae bacterium]|jgi:DHA1 family tetracycline resistance protein-like MFS transporter
MRRPAFIFVFVTVALDMLALGMIIPVLPKLVVSFSGGDTAHGAEIFGLFGTVWALMQFFSSPLLGALSDRFGRRPVILISNFGLGFDYILMALAPNLILLFIGRVISGICAASISTSYAYIADVVSAEKRAGAFGLIGAAFGLGFILGPGLGGILGSIDPRLPFWVAAALSLLNGLYGLFVLPESLQRENRAAFRWSRANPVAALRLLRSHHNLFGLATIAFLSNLAHVVLQSTFVLYAGYRYRWNERDVGFALALVGVCSMIVQAGLIRAFVRRFGERTALLCGLVCGSIGFTIFGLAPTGNIFLIGILFTALWGLAGPAAMGLMSRCVDATEQGRLQGANSSLNGIAALIGPLVFTHIFALFIGPSRPMHLPGAPFLLSALLLAVAFGCAYRLARPIQKL